MQRKPKRAARVLGLVGLATAVSISSVSLGNASSHREAPQISQDPVADHTDVYAFVAPDAPDAVTLVGNWIPFEAAAGGPNFYRFGDDVLHTFNVDNNGDAVSDVTYEFRFRTVVNNPNTYLYNTGPVTSLTDPDLNIHQYYSMTEVKNGVRTTLAENLEVAPAAVGPRSTPGYAANLAKQATYSLPNGIKVFAGPRDDPFYADLGSIFDLGGLRPLNQAHLLKLPTSAGRDGLAGKNVHSIVLQVPKARVVNADPVIGVWSDSYRRKVRVLSNDGAGTSSGEWVKVSRLGMPLVNEVVVPVGAKDRFNASFPIADGQFAAGVLDPELARLIPILYPGVTVPAAPRTSDIVPIFLTGIPGLNQPANVKPSEMLRLNTSIAPTPWAQQNRLGLLAGQNDGFPNGRRLIDDVVDIELRAVAGGTPFTPDFNKFPNNALTDGVNGNDRPLLTSFPYVAPPFAGYDQ